MHLACLQFAPALGKVGENIARANALLQDASSDIDLLVLPELAFSGYNFSSFNHIQPFLEPTAAGPSSAWARATAARLQCLVTVGYPEIASSPGDTADSDPDIVTAPVCYNSTITVSPQGNTLAHYRKTHLYYTDETWAQESDTKWLNTTLPLQIYPSLSTTNSREGDVQSQSIRTTFGICMDLNPRQFTAPWTLYELASFTISSGTQLLLLSMAWLTQHTDSEWISRPEEPDLETLGYWVERIVPLVNNEDREIIVVFANRCGQEPEDARYAGSSWIGRVGFGKIKIWKIAGRHQEAVLAINTDQDPKYVVLLEG